MKRLTLRSVAVAIATGLTLTLVPINAAIADDNESLNSLLSRVAPETLENIYNPATRQKLVATPATVPGSTEEPITARSEEGAELSIWLPDAASVTLEKVAGVTVTTFDHGNARSVPLVKTDGSVQILTVIEGADAPGAYQYELSLPEATVIALDAEGFIHIKASDGSFLGGIAPAWATDSTGRAVPTHYEVSGTVITQVVDHAAGDFSYPIVADPWLGQDLYYSPFVRVVSQGYTVNVTPRPWGQTWAGPATWWAHRDEVVSKLGGNSWRWTNSIQEQFYCHIAGLPASLPQYNLESWRPTIGWAQSLAQYRCNPYDGAWS